MTLARKGSRRITVDGVVFRWKVRRKPTYCQAHCWTPFIFAVERVDTPGSLLVAVLPFARPDNWMECPSGVVRPAMVEQGIRRALASGWRSEQSGLPFKLAMH